MIEWIDYNNYKYCYVSLENLLEIETFINKIYEDNPDTIEIKQHKTTQVYYTNIFCSFDIETTLLKDIEQSFMYIAQIQVNDYIFLCRDWGLVSWVFGIISYHEFNTICAVANFGYEFQFLRARFNFEWVFSKDSRNIMQAQSKHILFIDILMLNNSSLKQLAKTYTKTQKLDGDKFNYSKIRHKQTKLNDYEIAYCLNDVIICVEFMQWLFKNIIIPKQYIPLTSTNILRNEIKADIKSLDKNVKQKIYFNIKNQQADDVLYNYAETKLFRGGYVHSSYNKTGYVIDNVQAYDKKSSYPQSMLFKYVPVSKFKKVIRIKDDVVGRLLKSYCCIMEVEFINIKVTTHISLESEHKVINIDNYIKDNGRIMSADRMTVALTELDFELYKKLYKWDSMIINKMWYAKRGLLPRYIRDKVLYYFNLKNTTPKETVEYKLAKAKLNSFYGMCVTKVNRLEYMYNGTSLYEEDIENAKESTYFNFMWGVWITAQSRYDLMNLSYQVHKYLIYNDTDSLYCEDNELLKQVVEKYNNECIKQQLTIADKEGYNVEGVELLGTYEDDGFYEKFKTLGAKRYIKQDNGKIKVTVSGLPKNVTGINFDNFENGLTIKGCKQRSKYNDDYFSAWVDDGETVVKVSEYNNIAILDTNFSMSIDPTYDELLCRVHELERKGSYCR